MTNLPASYATEGTLPEEPPARGARILVIDDELGMREGCRRALSALGHRVDTADGMISGLDQIRQNPYDLVLLDVMMPGGSGVDLIGPIHEEDPDTSCIIITGYATVELAVEAIKRGAYDFLSKPFTTDQLVVAVDQGLERRHLAQQAKRLAAIEAQAQEMAQAMAEMERLDQAKSQLMLKVAHELRAPTAAVQSYINLILSGYISDKELRPTLLRVQERLKQTLETVGDLLELARLKQAKEQLKTSSPQPMAQILQEVSSLLEEEARERGQELQVRIEGQPMVRASRQDLTQLWTNLMSNAIKYTPKGGRITASLRTDGNCAIGEVEDSGIGIAENDLPNLFQEFFRTGQAKATGEIGTGLGLSIVKEIIDSYHGEIRVTSSLGHGSCFTFVLPADSPPTAAGVSGQVKRLSQ